MSDIEYMNKKVVSKYGVGRPRKADALRRTAITFTVLLTEKDNERFQSLANRYFTTKSELLRTWISRGVLPTEQDDL